MRRRHNIWRIAQLPASQRRVTGHRTPDTGRPADCPAAVLGPADRGQRRRAPGRGQRSSGCRRVAAPLPSMRTGVAAGVQLGGTGADGASIGVVPARAGPPLSARPGTAEWSRAVPGLGSVTGVSRDHPAIRVAARVSEWRSRPRGRVAPKRPGQPARRRVPARRHSWPASSGH